MQGRKVFCLMAGLLLVPQARAQVSGYTFSQEVGIWQPIAGSGTPMGMPGLGWPFTFDDNSFVENGQNLPLGSASTGNGWPIGFTFTFNGQPFDRVGLSMEGWLAFGNSVDGQNAVYVPNGPTAYAPLSTAVPESVSPLKRNRVAAFSMNLAAMGNGGTWPLQIKTVGFAPNRRFIAEWNVVRSGGGGGALRFQVILSEGGGMPSAQTVQVVFGSMTQSIAMLGQVGLGGNDPSDFNNRSVSVSPFNWLESVAGAVNTANCRIPSAAANLPEGLTFTWTPPACVVSGVSVTGLTNVSGVISGTLTWAPLADATSYDYVITAGAPTDPPILSGSGIAGTSVELVGLPADQDLYAYVRADCGDGEGEWGTGQAFTTEGVVEVVCGAAPIQLTHCYTDLEVRSWHYSSSSGARIRAIIHAGTIQSGDQLVFHDGPNVQAPVLFSSTSGAIAGQVITSTTGHLTMRLVADNSGSCAMHDFILPMAWEVGCLDCEPVLANYNVVDDCDNGQFTVQVGVVSIGSSASAVISNNVNNGTVAVAGPGLYVAGPFPINAPVLLTVEHDYNAYCSSLSLPLINGTCPVVSCGPDDYTYCYTDGDIGQWAYTSGGSERIGVRFRHGSLATADHLRFYDGLDVFGSLLLQQLTAVDLSGRLVTSPVGGNTIMLEAAANASLSCASGQADEWDYVVACYDGCTQPVASYTVVDDCANGQFSVAVNVTGLGSGGSVVLQNDGGAPGINVATVGSYTVGPFAATAEVTVEVVGTSVLCTTNSTRLVSGCGVGVQHRTLDDMMVFPNPSEGMFNIRLPHGFGGRAEMDVLDLSGRWVAGDVVRANPGGLVPLELDQLPVGSYVLRMNDGERQWTAAIRIVR